MKYALATIQSMADIVKTIVLGTVMRLAMILALIVSDIGLWLVMGAWLAAKW